MRTPVLAFASLLLWSQAAWSQNPVRGKYAPAVERITALAEELAAAMNARDAAASETRRAAFVAGVDAMLALPEVLAMNDYNRAATIAMNVRCPAVCQKIARHAIAKLEQPGQLREFLGIANMALAQQTDRDAEMRALAAEAIGALEIWCEAKPGSVGPGYLVQAYATLGEWQRAVAWDDRLLERKSRLAVSPAGRSILLLGAGQWGQVCERLRQPETTEGIDAAEVDVLMSRAEALRGNHDVAIARARDSMARKASDTAVAALADVLAFAGKHDEALALLKKQPMTETNDDARLQAGLRKSRAVFEYLIALRDKRPADLRQRLGALLEARFVVMGMKQGDAAAKAMAGSPWALAHVVRSTPTGPANWANDVLFAVCVRDVARYVQPEAERKLLGVVVDAATRTALTGTTAWNDALRDARCHLVLADKPGALVVRQLLDRL